MKPLDRFDRLARTASREAAPRFDVTAGVMQRLSSNETRDTRSIPLGLFAAMSSIAAAVVLVVAIQAWMDWQDPLVALLCSVDVVIQ